jgi:signal transduction histidine kinase
MLVRISGGREFSVIDQRHTAIAGGTAQPVERLFAAAYQRLGRRYVPAVVVVLSGMLAVMAAFLVVTVARVQSTDATTGVSLALGAFVVVGVCVAIVYTRCRSEIGVFNAWIDGPPSAELARDAWHAAIALPASVPRRAAVPGVLLIASYGAITFIAVDASAAAAIIVFVGALVLLLGVGLMLAVVGLELAVRPGLREVAAFLPDLEAPPQATLPIAARLRIVIPLTSFAVALVAVLYVAPGESAGDLAVAILVVLGASLTFGLATALIVGESLTGPVAELMRIANAMRSGDANARAPVFSGDELGRLTHDFNNALGELQASRARVVAAGDAARRRVERDLHDGAQQRLIMLRLKLGLHAHALADQPAASQVAELQTELAVALEELRELAHGIYPAALESDGLRGALEEAAPRCSIATTVTCDGANRYPRELETAVYFCCLEALQNAAKHAGDDAQVAIDLAARDDALHFTIRDNGPGFDPSTDGAGLQNMRDRIGALGGELQIDSAPGAGTTVRGRVTVSDQPRA